MLLNNISFSRNIEEQGEKRNQTRFQILRSFGTVTN
jgi:hypothetical protein